MKTVLTLVALLLLAACGADGAEHVPGGNIDVTGRWRLVMSKQNGDADVTWVELVQQGEAVTGNFCSNGICDREAISGSVEGTSIVLEWSAGRLHAEFDADGMRFSGDVQSTDPSCVVCEAEVVGTRDATDAGAAME